MNVHHGPEQKKTLQKQRSNDLLFHELESEIVSAAERVSEATGVEQTNKWSVQVNERTDERVAQYLRLGSCLFQTTVQCFHIPANTTSPLCPHMSSFSYLWLGLSLPLSLSSHSLLPLTGFPWPLVDSMLDFSFFFFLLFHFSCSSFFSSFIFLFSSFFFLFFSFLFFSLTLLVLFSWTLFLVFIFSIFCY